MVLTRFEGIFLTAGCVGAGERFGLSGGFCHYGAPSLADGRLRLASYAGKKRNVC